MIYECTDCEESASFSWGYRIICLADTLEPNEVCRYYPVGDRDAFDCVCFYDGLGAEFTQEQFSEAEDYSEAKYGEITYQGIREWVLDRLKEVSSTVSEK